MRQRLWQSGLLLPAMTALWAAAVSGQAPAQETPPPEKPAPASTQAADVLPGEVLPQVFHLRDREGNLQPVPGITYEQFMELWKQQQGIVAANARPRYSLQSLVLSGTASGGSAKLVAKATIAVHDAGWVGVPLRLNEAVLLEQPVYAGDGDHEIDVLPERNGHIVWIRGAADETHEVTLQLAVAVERVGAQSRLRLNMPRAAVSQLQLRVPLPQAAAQVSEGSRLEAARPLAGGTTELRVIGLAGEFELSWHPADAAVASQPVILQATSAQEIRVRDDSVNTTATLKVHSLGSEFDRFRVRLPPGADYVRTTQSRATMVAVDAAAASGKVYEIKLDEKTTGPVEVQLATQRAHQPAEGGEVLELAGFEVLGAVRQSGTIVVEIEGNWHIFWGQADGVRPVDDVSGLSSRAAKFEFTDQPYSLPARVVERKTRIRVQPQYVLLVSGQEVQLNAQLHYMVRGAQVRSLAVVLNGWEVDEVGPASLVNADQAIAGAGESIEIPLVQETGRELELTFEARRKIAPGSDKVSWELPRPRGDVAAADLVVVSDDNVELVPLPEDEDFSGLVPQAVRPQLKLPQRQQEALHYRAAGASAGFVASIKLHQQSISTSVDTQLTVGTNETQVDQRLIFQVAYEPTDHFTLRVPRSIRPERMMVLYEGERLFPIPVRPGATSDDEMGVFRVNLPAPRIGECELRVSFAMAHENPQAETSALVSVPLVVPGEGQLTANTLTVIPAAGVAVNYPTGPWNVEQQSEATRPPATLTLQSERALGEVTLGVSFEQSPTENTTIVERAWIQTRLTAIGRQDRAFIRLATRQRQVQLRLPDGADERSLVLEVDGVEIAPEAIRRRQLTIPLPSGPRGEHLLEIRYRFTDRPPAGSLILEGPQIPSAGWVQQLYWQLILPENEHVLLAPSSYAEEHAWVWSDYYWRRQPTLDGHDLADWIAAGPAPRFPGETSRQYAARKPLSALGANRYLYSAVGTMEPLDVYTSSRARLVLLGSLPLLIIGLALIYFPAARHPAALFAVAVAVAAASFVAPRSALLLAQASALGLVLVGVAVMLARLLPRAAPAVVPVRGSSQAIRERSVTERYQRPPSGSSQPPSTATDPLVPTSPEADS